MWVFTFSVKFILIYGHGINLHLFCIYFSECKHAKAYILTQIKRDDKAVILSWFGFSVIEIQVVMITRCNISEEIVIDTQHYVYVHVLNFKVDLK